MSTDTKEITLENVGPIRNLSLPVPEGGGVVVLRGHNGVGKSHALAAIDTLARGGGSISVRDGQTKAIVQGMGITLKFQKRASRSGELEVVALSGDVDIGRFVDPGIDDPEKADAARIRELTKILGTSSTPESFQVSDTISIQLPDGETDPVKLAALAKRAYQAAARDYESLADSLSGELKVATEEASTPIEYDGTTDENELRKSHDAAYRKLLDLESRRQQQVELIERAEAAKERHAKLSAGHGEALADAQAALELSEKMRTAARQEVDELQAKMDSAKQSLHDATARHDKAKAVLAEREQQAKQIEAARLEIDSATAIALIDEGQIEAARQAVSDAEARSETAKALLWKQENAERAKKLTAKKTMAEASAAKAREAAAAVDKRLNDLINSASCSLIVDGGRLFMRTDRGMELFDDLSHGEKVKVAIDAAIGGVSGGLLTMDQTGWEGLDPRARNDVACQCEKYGVTLYTAQADHGELRAEVFAK